MAPLAPKGLLGAVFGYVPLGSTTVACPVSVVFPGAVVVLIVSVNVGSILICVHTLILMRLVANLC